MAKKIIILFVVLAVCLGSGIAQRSRFVYLQTDDLTPFYIQMNGKTISSTSAGYLLIGKLTDSIYPVKLGVLGSNDVQEYGIKIDGKDAGYIIKKSATQGWAITNLQTNQSQMSMEYASALAAEDARKRALVVAEQQRVQDSIALETVKAEQAKKDSIAAATAAIATQDSVKAAAAIVPESAKPDSAASVVTSNAAATEKEGVGASSVVVPAAIAGVVIAANKSNEDSVKTTADSATILPAKNAQQLKADSITKVIAEKEKELKELMAALAATAAVANADSAKAQQENTSSKSFVAMDTVVNANTSKQAADSATTIAVSDSAKVAPDTNSAKINPPPSKPEAAAAVVATPALLDMEFGMSKDSAAAKTADSLKATTATTAKPDTLVPAIPAVVENEPNKTDTVTTAAIPKPVVDSVPVAAAASKVQRQPCGGMLSRDEIDAAITKATKLADADDMIAVYKETFSFKCITTSALKKIAATLASDVSKYKLYEAAYAHTLDYYEYAELGSSIKDPYYSNKFKTLIQQ